MPFVRELFAAIGDVELIAGRSMTPGQVATADLLLVRSVTRVDDRLLAQASKLRFVGSATAGVEHLDLNCLRERGIVHASAPGCNRLAVAEYVLSALLWLSQRHEFDLTQRTVAIIGAGNTGTAVADKLAVLGIDVRLCDPPLKRAGDPRKLVSFKQALQADIVSLHVPMTRTGADATWHLLDQAALGQLRTDQILINASRGAVIDHSGLLAIKSAGQGPVLVFDVWEPEPDFDPAMLPHVSLATPHIAGYTLEARARGTLMLYQAVCQLLQTPTDMNLEHLVGPAGQNQIVTDPQASGALWQQLVPLAYDIGEDDRLFRQQALEPGGFDHLRKTYRVRREFSSLGVANISAATADQLSALGFSGCKLSGTDPGRAR